MQELCQSASTLATEVLCEGGLFLCKMFQGAHTASEKITKNRRNTWIERCYTLYVTVYVYFTIVAGSNVTFYRCVCVCVCVCEIQGLWAH